MTSDQEPINSMAFTKRLTPGERLLSGGHFCWGGLTVPFGVGQATCRYSGWLYPL